MRVGTTLGAHANIFKNTERKYFQFLLGNQNHGFIKLANSNVWVDFSICDDMQLWSIIFDISLD